MVAPSFASPAVARPVVASGAGVFVCLALVSISGTMTTSCKRARAEVDGIGDYTLGKTTIAEAGACSDRGEYTYCSTNGAVKIGGQKGNVDLYFRKNAADTTGKDADDAFVTEILVVVNRCKTDPIESELLKELGPTTAETGRVLAWVGKKATIIARLPADKSVCEVSFLHPSEQERIAKLSPPGVDLSVKPSE